MSFFDDLRQKTAEVVAGIKNEFAKHKNANTLNALMATCAHVAAADGLIDPTEKRKMIGFVKNSPIISVFGDTAAIKVFTEHADRFEFDQDIGSAEALRAIGQFKGQPDVARLIIRAGIAIGNADGSFDDDEKSVMRKICAELGENPGDFGL